MAKSITLFFSLFVFTLTSISQNKKVNKNKLTEPARIDTIRLTDTLWITNSPTPFREKPEINSKQLKEIPTYFVLRSFIGIGEYYEVVINDTTGYVPIAFLNKYKIDTSATFSSTSFSPSTPSQTTTSPSQTNSSPSRTTSSPSHTSSSKGCSSVQCSGITTKKTRCRNTTTNCSGRCYLH